MIGHGVEWSCFDQQQQQQKSRFVVISTAQDDANV